MMKLAYPKTKAFTLIEIMLVVAIIGIALAMGMPAIRRMATPDPMTQAVKDMVDMCSNARARAILTGVPMELRIYPQSGKIEVVQAPEDVNLIEQNSTAAGNPAGASPQPPMDQPETGNVTTPRIPTELQTASAQLSDHIRIDMCDINFGEYKDLELAPVRFHPNGICDMFTIVLRSDKNEYKKISLEEVTGLVEVDDIK